ncbi:MAG: YetF domain-containing protein [Limnochordia bacterium]
MLIIAARTLILYFLLVFVTRVMGKRQVGELQPFEFVLAILLADMAAISMGDKETPLLNSLVTIFTLTLAHVLVSYIALCSQRVRRLVCGRPSVVIENGIIQEHTMRSLRYSINDLLEQLRGKGYPNVADVEYALLETNGKLSVLPKSQHRPLTPGDMAIPTGYEGLPLTLIVDGKIDHEALRRAGLNAGWLQDRLQEYGITAYKDVLFASLDTAGRLFLQTKEASREPVIACVR